MHSVYQVLNKVYHYSVIDFIKHGKGNQNKAKVIIIRLDHRLIMYWIINSL